MSVLKFSASPAYGLPFSCVCDDFMDSVSQEWISEFITVTCTIATAAQQTPTVAAVLATLRFLKAATSATTAEMKAITIANGMNHASCRLNGASGIVGDVGLVF